MINTLQTIVDDVDCKGENPDFTQNMIEDYMGKGRDILDLIELINQGAFSPQDGAGSPENVIESNYSKTYIDTNTNTRYFNPVLGAKTGWVVA